MKPTTLVGAKQYKNQFSTTMNKILFTAVTVAAFSIGALNAAPPVIPFLPSPQNIPTVPPNGDQNPYGVAFVPHDFKGNGGPLQPGDILVSNFNNSDNKQGTGTTIVRIGADGSFSTFFCRTASSNGILRFWSFYSARRAAEGFRDCWKRAIDGWHHCDIRPRLVISDR